MHNLCARNARAHDLYVHFPRAHNLRVHLQLEKMKFLRKFSLGYNHVMAALVVLSGEFAFKKS